MTKLVSIASLARSRLAERASPPAATVPTETPLARVEVDEGEARAWRVVLGRPERSDGLAPVVAGTPQSNELIFPAVFAYTAGEQQAPVAPPAGPRRTNEVPLGVYAVQIAFGSASGSINRMIAHWPRTGGSVTVYGSYVEVWALTLLTPPVTALQPVFNAAIVPDDNGNDSELSIVEPASELLAYAGGFATVQFVPDFARRVRVSLTRQIDLDVQAPPVEGDPPTRLLWVTEGGTIAHSAYQCTDGTATIATNPNAPVTWHEVPATAVMLVIVGPAGFFAQTHWRVAP